MSHPVCFFCPDPGTVLLYGTPFCTSHAVCHHCLASLTTEALTCRCDQEGYGGHEEWMFCSEACRDASHDEPDRELEPEDEEESRR